MVRNSMIFQCYCSQVTVEDEQCYRLEEPRPSAAKTQTIMFCRGDSEVTETRGKPASLKQSRGLIDSFGGLDLVPSLRVSFSIQRL